VVIISIGNQYDKPKLVLSGMCQQNSDYLRMQGPNQASVINLLVQGCQQIVSTILNTERMRTVELNKKYYDKPIHENAENHSLLLAVLRVLPFR
jgi:hypothetical protein